MNSRKRAIAGVIITLVGVLCLICMAVVFIKTATNTSGIRLVTIFGVPGVLFLISGITLTRYSLSFDTTEKSA